SPRWGSLDSGADGGSVLVMVLVSFMLLAVVMLSTVTYTSQGTKQSRYEQDVERAEAAVMSGLGDFLALLRAKPDYLENPTPAMATDPDWYCHNEATGGPDNDMFASICGWGATTPTRWKLVDHAEAGDSKAQAYHYAVRDVPTDAERIEVEVTGRSNGVYRAVKAALIRETTSTFLYITNYELTDPTDINAYGSSRAYWENQEPKGKLTSPVCGGGWTLGSPPAELDYGWNIGVREYQPTGTGAFEACQHPVFIGGDVLEGRVHTNDEARVVTVGGVNPKFTGQFSTANKNCDPDTNTSLDPNNKATWLACFGDPASPGLTKGVDLSAMPKFEKHVLPSVNDPNAASLSGIGCRYEGATRIIFNADGTMRVWAKDMSATTVRPLCGSLADLTSTDGALVNVPADGLIFVAASPTAQQRIFYREEIGGPAGRQIPLGEYQSTSHGTCSSIGLAPRTVRVERNMAETGMYKGVGNVYVEGNLSGRLTLAAEKNIVITGDLVAVDKTKDIIGLTAGHAVEIYRPRMIGMAQKCTQYADGRRWGPLEKASSSTNNGSVNVATWPTDYDGNAANLEIDAAIHAASASFRVQNYADAPVSGTLTVFGSIAQNFRGTIGRMTGTTPTAGYMKNYKYNPVLETQTPPNFPSLVNGAWVARNVTKADPLAVLKN
ncbi:MAG: hypothetical protein LBO20_02325, partial [Bifidobacteriaceae bacterium]|nr:hypothetical protein [Bifidobacteriaceae bacterium]